MTLIEVLLATTILMMVFNMFYHYMSTQNRQITTIIQKNELEETANLAMQYLANDIKSAKRATVSVTASSLTMERFIEESKDSKKSAQLALEKIEYKFDTPNNKLTRTASKYNPDDYDAASDSFKSAPQVYESKTFNKITVFEPARIPMPKIVGVSKIDSHSLGVEIKLCAEALDVLMHVSQKSYKQDKIYIRDEVAFKNQPFWNVNPKVTKVGPISLKFTDALSINLSQTEVISWIASLKKMANVKLAFEDISNQLMVGLSREALAQVTTLYSGLISKIEGEVKNKAKEIIADKIVHDFGLSKSKIAAGLLLKDFILSKNSSDCQSLKSRIIDQALDDDEIKNFIKENAENLKKYGIVSASEVLAINDATASVEIISRVSQLIYDAKGDLPKLIFKYVESLSLSFANEIKTQVCAKINVSNYIQQKINVFIDPAIDEVMGSIGVKSIIDNMDQDSDFSDIAKIAIKTAVDSLKSWLKDQINQKLSDFTQTLLKTVTNNVSESFSGAKTEAEVQQALQNQSMSDDIGGAINDIFSSVLITISKNLLLGNKWDAAANSFIPSGAKDYLNTAFKDFSYDISSVLNSDEQKAITNDEQIRKVEEIMNNK